MTSEHHAPALSFAPLGFPRGALRINSMPRTARVVIPGTPLHITQRGSRHFDVFRDEADRLDYLKLFSECCREFLLRIVAYCLMTNHVHFVAIPEREDSIARVFHRAHGAHAQRFNIKYGLVGHLWQERPFSCALDEAHLWNAIRYVEQNPVRAGMVSRAADFRWYSAPARCRGQFDPLLDTDPKWAAAVPNWTEWLDGVQDSLADQFIRDCTFTGRPCGDETFIKRVEQATNRDFTRKKPGPKPKDRSEQVPDDRLLF